MEFVVFIGFVIVFILLSNLRGRIWKLERAMRNPVAQNVPAVNNSTQVTSQIATHAMPAKAVTPAPVSYSGTGTTWIDDFTDWAKEDWLLKLGALLLIIGFGWLTTYAFLNNWIGPMGRITLGIVAGSLFILLGYWRIKDYTNQGSVFLVLGSTVILLTVFAAREVYDFFTPISALVLMFLSTSFVAFASVKYNSRALALMSLILAGIAPLLIAAPVNDYIARFAYLFVVILGAIWIVALTGRRELITAALILITLYSLPHLFNSHLVDREKLLFFSYAFTSVFFLTSILGIIKQPDKNITADLLTSGANGLFLLAWIMVAAPEEWQSLIIAAWMIVFAVGAFSVFKITNKKEPFYVYAGVCIALLAAATSAELSGATLTIAYTIESAVIAIISYFVLRDIKIAQRINFLFIVPIMLSFDSIDSRVWRTSVWHQEFFVLFILGLTLMTLGWFFLDLFRDAEDKKHKEISAALLIIGSIYMYVLLWLSLHAALSNDDTATMLALVVYTIIGLAIYFYGLTNGGKVLRLYSGLLLAFVILRLLFVDIWKMALAGRVVTFFVIGLMLVATAFLGKKRQN